MNKQLIIFLLVMAAVVGGMVYYHQSTPNPYNSPVFFGEEARDSEPDMANKPSKMAQPGRPAN